MHVKNSKNILTLIIGGRLKSENSFEHFSLIIKLNFNYNYFICRILVVFNIFL